MLSAIERASLLSFCLLCSCTAGEAGNEADDLPRPNSLAASCIPSPSSEMSGTTPLGISLDDARDAVRGTRSAVLSWADGTTSALEVDITDESAFFATSAPDDGSANIPTQCASYIAVLATLKVDTSDGRLSERLSNVAFTTTDGVNYNALTRGLPFSEVQGAYEDVHENHCVTDLNFVLHIAGAEFDGEVLEQVRRGPCSVEDPIGGISEANAGVW